MFLCNCGYYFESEDLALDCLLHTNSDIQNIPRLDQEQLLTQLDWNSNTTKLLINTCVSENVMGSCRSNKEKQDRWVAVAAVFKEHGYDVPSRDTQKEVVQCVSKA